MNQRVRTYLIEAAKNGNSVFYSRLIDDCELGIDLGTREGMTELKNVLSEVSGYEVAQGRHMLSAIVISVKEETQSFGFYILAEELKFGNAKELAKRKWGEDEAERCKNFWQTPSNYARFAREEEVPDFFNEAEIEFFKKWHLQVYNKTNPEHIEVSNRLRETVWKKTAYLGKQIQKRFPQFVIDTKMIWHQRGWTNKKKKQYAVIIKPYTWAKLYRQEDKGKSMFFSFGLEAYHTDNFFLYKLDCQQTSSSKLTHEQIDVFKKLIPASARKTIPFEKLVELDWNSLIELCVRFTEEHIAHYDSIVDRIWNGKSIHDIPEGVLERREMPEGIHLEIPSIVRTFTGYDTDYLAKNKEQKELGDAGENLVLKREREYLRSKNKEEEAQKVRLKLPGEGFDVLSFDLQGRPRYIEVKTTTGDEHTPFFISQNEIDFMRRHPEYCIYRVYNYNKEKNNGLFFEISNDTESQLLMEPVNYRVYLKKKN